MVEGWREVMVRVGVNGSVDRSLLKDFTREVELVWIPDQPQGTYEIDFWIPTSHPRHVPEQWPHMKGVRVVQAPWAGVDLLRHVFPAEVILCDARGVHDIPTAEWAVAALLLGPLEPITAQRPRKGHIAAS